MPEPQTLGLSNITPTRKIANIGCEIMRYRSSSEGQTEDVACQQVRTHPRVQRAEVVGDCRRLRGRGGRRRAWGVRVKDRLRYQFGVGICVRVRGCVCVSGGRISSDSLCIEGGNRVIGRRCRSGLDGRRGVRDVRRDAHATYPLGTMRG